MREKGVAEAVGAGEVEIEEALERRDAGRLAALRAARAVDEHVEPPGAGGEGLDRRGVGHVKPLVGVVSAFGLDRLVLEPGDGDRGAARPEPGRDGGADPAEARPDDEHRAVPRSRSSAKGPSASPWWRLPGP